MQRCHQHPNQHDYDELVTIYSHLDSFTTIGASVPGASAAEAGNSPSSWGTLVSGSRAHGHSVYVRDLGQGEADVTFVIWA